MQGDRPWFRRKRFGLGFVPVAWPDWVITMGIVAIAIGLDTLLRDRHRVPKIAMIAVMAIGLWIVAAQHSAD